MTELLSLVSSLVIICWIVPATVIYVTRSLGREPDRILRTLYHELRPLYLPAVLASIAIDIYRGEMLDIWTLISDTCMLINWWYFKDVDKDDRWKRRREKGCRASRPHRLTADTVAVES